jgi:NAD(P)-dependent dehydrogenase (short-subunit alcohol dehydrogenase family)
MPSALVTGSNRGIGLALARQLAPAVDHLVATCRRPDDAGALRALADAHDGVHVVALDVSDPASIDDAVAYVEDAIGRLSLLVNNAGIAGGKGNDRFGTLDADRMATVLRVNTVGPTLLAQRAADVLAAAAEAEDAPAKVVNITSQLGSIARVGGSSGWLSYRASKAALNMLTACMAYDLKPRGVVAVAVHPGWVRTDMGGSSAAVAPEDAATGILRVADALTPADAGRFLTFEGDEMPW